MAAKGFFLDNESYSAEDVNRAFSCLTTEGVSLFSDTGGAAADINAAVASLTSEGVDMYNIDSCKVVKSGELYTVQKGVCFLPGGAFVSVDSDGFVLDVTSGVKNYVYAMHDALKNICTIFVSDEAGGEGAVPLAEIDENGKITDKRVFAVAKLAVPTANITASKKVTLKFPVGEVKGAYTYYEDTIDLGFGGFNYVRAVYGGETVFGYIANGEKIWFLDATRGGVWVQKNGSTLVITTGTWGDYRSITEEVELFFF